MLRPAEEAVGLVLGDEVSIGDGALFGPHVTVFGGAQIGTAA